MKFLLVLFVTLVGICLSQAASTTRRPMHSHHTHGHATGTHVTKPHHSHGTHPTREPAEKEQISFNYAPKTQRFYIHIGNTCYIAQLTPDESMAVHTDAGIRALELRFLQSLASATSLTADQLSTDEAHSCGKRATSFFMFP